VEKPECFKPFLFPLIIVADEYRVRLKIPVNVLIYFKVILIKGTLGYAQTRSVPIADPSIRPYGLPGDFLYLKFVLR